MAGLLFGLFPIEGGRHEDRKFTAWVTRAAKAAENRVGIFVLPAVVRIRMQRAAEQRELL